MPCLARILQALLARRNICSVRSLSPGCCRCVEGLWTPSSQERDMGTRILVLETLNDLGRPPAWFALRSQGGMRKVLKTTIWIVACCLTFSRPGLADSIPVVVGTNLSSVTQGGAGLCPLSDDCSIQAQQFTLFAPVLVDQLVIALNGPDLYPYSAGSFDVSLASQPWLSGEGIGSGAFSDSNSADTTEVFDFENLDIPLSPGKYYVVIAGDNLALDIAPLLATFAGTFGPTFYCAADTLPCNEARSWQVSGGPPFAIDIDGTVSSSALPEPSGWLLFGTGLFALYGITRRKSHA